MCCAWVMQCRYWICIPCYGWRGQTICFFFLKEGSLEILQFQLLSENRINIPIWLVVWNMNLFFFHMLGISSSQLTNSIIFQRGGSTTNQLLTYIKMVSFEDHTFHSKSPGRSWQCPLISVSRFRVRFTSMPPGMRFGVPWRTGSFLGTLWKLY